jgi:hypothetical protein
MKTVSLIITLLLFITNFAHAEGDKKAGAKLDCFSELTVEMPHQGRLSTKLQSFLSKYRRANIFSGPATITHDDQAHVLKMTLVESFLVKDSTNPGTSYSTYQGMGLVVMKNDLKQVLRQWIEESSVESNSKLVRLEHIGCTTQTITFIEPKLSYTFE